MLRMFFWAKKLVKLVTPVHSTFHGDLHPPIGGSHCQLDYLTRPKESSWATNSGPSRYEGGNASENRKAVMRKSISIMRNFQSSSEKWLSMTSQWWWLVANVQRQSENEKAHSHRGGGTWAQVFWNRVIVGFCKQGSTNFFSPMQIISHWRPLKVYICTQSWYRFRIY